MRRLIAMTLCLCLLMLPIQAKEPEKLVALTFDDGPSGKYTRKLLDGLQQRDARATFLLCGYRIEQYPELTERIFQEGHEIGLHGYSHKFMQDMCRAEVTREIRQVLELLPEGCNAAFLRSPGGLCSDCVIKTAADHGLAILHWSVDPKDWAIHDAEAIEQEILSHVRDGDVILLHDMSDSSVDAALAIIDELQEEGYRFVTATELAQAKGVPLVPGQIYTRFEPPNS